MNINAVIEIVIEALKNVNNPRFFKTERGYQGQFACAMYDVMEGKNIFPDDAIIEEEYQKRINNHRTTQRPDLIIHIPIEVSGLEDRKENNFVVFAFKKEPKDEYALEDFDKLDIMFEELNYPIGIFININGSKKYFLDKYLGPYVDRIHEFYIGKNNNHLEILHTYIQNGKIVTEPIQ